MPFIEKTFISEYPQKIVPFLVAKCQMNERGAKRSIDKGRVLCEGVLVKSKCALIEGSVKVIYFEAESSGLFPLFETADFAVFDKPSGMLIHPKNLSSSNSLLDEARALYGINAGVVHRLDRETSGLVIVSKHKIAEKELKQLFEERKVSKMYHAWVKGKLEKEQLIDLPLSAQSLGSVHRVKSYISSQGKPSQTTIIPLIYNELTHTTVVEARPHTGRLHQIRAHLNAIGFPIVGDPLYGVNEEVTTQYLDGFLKGEERIKQIGMNRVMLQAQQVSFYYKNERFLIKSQLEMK